MRCITSRRTTRSGNTRTTKTKKSRTFKRSPPLLSVCTARSWVNRSAQHDPRSPTLDGSQETRHRGRHEDWVYRAGEHGRGHGRESAEGRPRGNGLQPVTGEGRSAGGAGREAGEVGGGNMRR